MTGFARADGEGLGISWVWEVKSVNGKSLDLRLRLVPGFDALEPQLRAMVAQRFRRGNFSANLTVTRIAPAAVRINRETLTQLLRLMNELAGEIEAAPPRLDGLLALRGVVETVENEDDAVLEKRRFAVLDGWATALDRLARARAEEGARLAALLQGQLEDLTALVAAAEGCAAAQPAAIGRAAENAGGLAASFRNSRGAGRPGDGDAGDPLGCPRGARAAARPPRSGRRSAGAR
jgi:uncharacterized protein (TIGR00255 family)